MTLFKSIEIQFPHFDQHILNTQDLRIEPKNQLSFIRGGNFFTSAMMVDTKNGQNLFLLKDHYDRLQQCYSLIFERSQLPFTFTQFSQWIHELADLNASFPPPYQVLAFVLGGPAESMGKLNGYQSGMMGSVKTLLLMAQPLGIKPSWVFDQGLNLVSITYQRLIAHAKPTLYLGGISGQNLINALNTVSLIECCFNNSQDLYSCVEKWTQIYMGFSPQEKKAFRLCFNSFYYDNIIPESSDTLTHTIQILISFMQREKKLHQHILAMQEKNVPNLLHEVCFKSKDHYLLEGSTFSIFGIDENGTFHLVPSDKNTSQNQEDLNEGNVLSSTCILFLKRSLELAKIPFKEKKIKLEKAKNLERLFVMSSTRLLSDPSTVRLVPVKSIDGQLMKSTLSAKALHHIQKLEQILNEQLLQSSD